MTCHRIDTLECIIVCRMCATSVILSFCPLLRLPFCECSYGTKATVFAPLLALFPQQFSVCFFRIAQTTKNEFQQKKRRIPALQYTKRECFHSNTSCIWPIDQFFFHASLPPSLSLLWQFPMTMMIITMQPFSFTTHSIVPFLLILVIIVIISLVKTTK